MTYNQIVEYLNDLDIYCIDNNHGFYDLKNYFKGLNEDLSQQDRQDIKNVIDATRSLPNDKAAETIAAVLAAKNNDTNEALEDDEEEYDDEEIFDKEFFKGNDGCSYKKLFCKTVTDYDGFNTDYCLYMKADPNEGVSYITIFGDSDLYTPDNSDVDFETNNTREAFEWFNSYNGFDDDLFDDDINESYLTEDIASTQKQYSHIPEEDFFQIIQLDPTFNPERDSVGKYGKWLLGLYKKDNPLNYEAKEIYSLLDTYNKLKNDRKYQIEKDINKFKSIDDIKSAINDVSSSELSDRQKERELRTSKDYDVVYKDKDWTIYVPTTYAGSCTLGKGTRWCTAYSDDDSYYKDYTEEGPLYILINNHDKSEKYQFHFESESFMDKDDDEIDVNEFFDEYPSVKKFFIKIGKVYDDSKPYVYEGGKISETVRNNVKSIIVSDSVTEIGDRCFAGCKSLQSVTIPDSVTELGVYCFKNCFSLQSITIPDSVIYIGYGCFDECASLQSITIPDSVIYIDGYCFSGCESLQSVTIPDSVTNIGDNCFNFCQSLESINIPDSVTKLGDECFYECNSLKSITISNSVTEIGNECFYNCESLESITIPNSVTELGTRCFYGCDLLKSITLPNSVTEIGDMCFCYCKSLTSITIPNSVSEISAGCFYGCKSLNTLITSKGSAAEMYFKENHPKVNIKYSTNESLKETFYNKFYKNLNESSEPTEEDWEDFYRLEEEIANVMYSVNSDLDDAQGNIYHDDYDGSKRLTFRFVCGVDKISNKIRSQIINALENYLNKTKFNQFIDIKLYPIEVPVGASYEVIIKAETEPIENLFEASYGGAYDIEDDMFFTKEELVEFGYDLVDKFSEWANCKADLEDVYMTSPTNLVMEVLEDDDISHQAKVKIDMRKIKYPKDIYKYSNIILDQWKDSYNDYHKYEESYSLKEYKDDYIAIANKTSRTNGASALNKDGTIRSVVGRYVLSNIDKDASILDFGAGKDAVQTQALRANGFKNVTAYDFGVNSKDGIHDPNALSKSYDVVFASNVLNVSSDQEMLEETISDIWNACKNGGTIIFNYPGSPRKAGFKADEVADIITSVTGQVPEVVVGPKSTPVWKLVKGSSSRLKEYYDKDKLKLPFRVIVDGTEYTLNFDEVDFILDNLNKVGISINDISEYEILDSDKEDEFIVTLKNGEKKKFNESVELKESKCHLKKYNKIKNESVTSRDEIPYTYEEMEADLEAGTHSWKKDNFECWVKYKKEFDDAMDILSKHYENVEDFGYDEGYYGLYATKPSIYESLNNRHFSRSLKLLENAGKSLQRSIIKCVDHFIDSNYEYPDGMFLAYSWEDLKDGVIMGLDPEFEISEGILDYFKNIENNFNSLNSKEKDLKDNLIKCMNDYLYKNGYDDRIE